MFISSLIQAIESTAPLAYAAEWDNSGLQVASKKKTCSALAVCLDPTPGTVTAAINLGCDCLVSHHPLALHPTLPNTLSSYHTVLGLLLANDMPLYAAHTSLDTNLEGPAGWLADELALQDRQALEPCSSEALRGFGLVGTLPKAIPAQLFLKKLIPFIPVETSTVIGELPKTIHTIAYCTGSGGSLISAAEAACADVYVSGDIKYHAALEASICVLDVGHHALEEEMMARFCNVLTQKIPTISVTFIPSTSPFKPLSQEIKSLGIQEDPL